MDKQPQGTSPGLLYVGSKVIKPDLISQDDYLKWYGDSHVPDVLKTSGVEEAYIWQAQDPTFERPVLVFYPLKDTGFLNTAEMGTIPTHYDDLPSSGNLSEIASLDVRSYKCTQLFAPENAKPGQSDFLVVAAMTPADDQDFDNFYRQEHLSDCATVPGWRRSERYELLAAFPMEGATSPLEPPKFLTLHYIDGETFPAAEMAKLGESEWTKKIMSGLKKSEMGVFEKVSYHKK
ncbi:unnamed protein product [Zymoseptoria tritici ST99CH_1A5]|uniref:EthD domain-containing protein n=2 Tax=Zymoseptoria tritici TaxID=1047171 RepID=A0A1X7RNN3_ZYMT9|nr:unnamed protein product [Zymoseptoria tritici ST99CH_3D7]SMR50042.1 unnamed protein product [Zymoseptoria tritici ST99CH_3D1]SMY22742.1 unnamed protein product [Zymoseptoria tritici ST99CH_1A5]